MIKYETPKIDITYFGSTDVIKASGEQLDYTNAAYNMNNAALDPNGQINAAAARTVKVQTILEFETN